MMKDDRSPDSKPSLKARVTWVFRTNHPIVQFTRDVVSSVLIVILIGFILFGVSGVWPPMVAVESGSMEPHMYRGDLVFLMDEHRLAPPIATGDTGVVTYQTAQSTGYTKFGDYGDVIVFKPNGLNGTPVIHRAYFWVDEGENWYDRADTGKISGGNCAAVPNCPAPHAGFITRGDNNPYYDQVSSISDPVRPSWIQGTAEVRLPWLGFIRLEFADL